MIGEVLQVGDKVVINIHDENWNWGYRPVKEQKGTVAEVTGFSEITHSRVQNLGREPGVYVNHCWVYLKGIENSIGSFNLELQDEEEYKRRVKEWREDKTQKKKIRDLPEMKFWEGDVANVNWGATRSPWKDEVEYKVARINYEYLDQKRNDGSPMPEYTITPASGGCGEVAVNESTMTLISRGNVWKYFNGEKVVFSDLNEEASFFSGLGHTDEVRNPANNLYSWTLEEVIQAVRDGIVDWLSVGNSLFSGELRHDAKRFRDRELGERVRQATIEGFKDLEKK